jgi:peptidoglycan/xylan/chitin deacetylase (PgdA/CDA1 family)
MLRRLKLLISAIYWACDQIWRAAGGLVGAPGAPRLVILYYHSVRPGERQRFAHQMDVLKRIADIAPADSAGLLKRGRRAAAVTFDDAFVSVVQNALPELAGRDIHCTIFAPAGVLGRNPTWDMESDGDQEETVVDAEALRRLPGRLVTIGAHSMTHPHLSKIPVDTARWEIAQSKAQLQEILGQDVSLFAFPYGDHDQTVVDLCREAGYAHAYTIAPQAVDPAERGLLRGRVAVSPSDGGLEFFLKASGAYSWMPLASRLKAALKRTGSPTPRRVERAA